MQHLVKEKASVIKKLKLDIISIKKVVGREVLRGKRRDSVEEKEWWIKLSFVDFSSWT